MEPNFKDFANEIITETWDGCDLTGGDIQDIAVKHGLLKLEYKTEPCNDDCQCAKVTSFPTECLVKRY